MSLSMYLSGAEHRAAGCHCGDDESCSICAAVDLGEHRGYEEAERHMLARLERYLAQGMTLAQAVDAVRTYVADSAG